MLHESAPETGTHSASADGASPCAPARRPEWLKVRLPQGSEYRRVRGLVEEHGLHTVCESARCPNIAECWGAGTATFMILGDICTRSCGFCAVKTGRPAGLDTDEPERLARAIKALNLGHAVITSVNRDELPDGGAALYARAIRRARELSPETSLEVLIPDFLGDEGALRVVMDARPEILNHNVETVPRLFKKVQPQDRYEWARATLSNAKALDGDVLTKSGLMVGLGETLDELKATIADIRSWGVDILTVGQYLQPSKRHLPIERYYTLDEFKEIKRFALETLGFRWVECAPLVRSSYHAEEQVQALSVVHRQL